jgi:hypothetical protein
MIVGVAVRPGPTCSGILWPSTHPSVKKQTGTTNPTTHPATNQAPNRPTNRPPPHHPTHPAHPTSPTHPPAHQHTRPPTDPPTHPPTHRPTHRPTHHPGRGAPNGSGIRKGRVCSPKRLIARHSPFRFASPPFRSPRTHKPFRCASVCVYFKNRDVELPVFRGFGKGGLVNPKGSSLGKTRMATKGCHSGAEKLRGVLLCSRAFPSEAPETLAMCGGVPPPRVWGSRPLPRVWGSAPSIAFEIIF